MSRIDDALTRVTGEPSEATKPSLFKRFVSESKTGRRLAVPGNDRRYPSVSAAAREAIEARSPAPVAPSRIEEDVDPTDRIFGLRQVVRYAGFACRAVLRHKVLVAFSFLLTFSMVVLSAKLAPRMYEIEVKLLAQRSAIMQSLSNPGRTVPYDVDAPTRAAAETVLRRDNVIALIRQTDLINEWDRTRAPILQFYDRWKARILRRQPTLEDKLDALVDQIEKRMVVSSADSKDGLVSIYLQWPDAHSGYLLVERAQQAFLEARQVAETQHIAEAIAVLERYGENLNKDIQVTLGELSRTESRILSVLPAARTPSSPTSFVARALDSPDPLDMATALDETVDSLVDPSALADPRLGRLKGAVSGKRGELTRLEYEQKRKLDELQAQLSVARTIYTPNHPSVQSLQQSVSAFQHNSPQIMALRNELDRLETAADDYAALAAERLIRLEMSRRGVTTRAPAVRRAASSPRALAPTPAPPPAPVTDITGIPRPNAVAEFATVRLRTELNQLQGILERTDAARIEFAVSRAAFKHRYSVISPAQEPGDQSFPDTRKVLIAGFVASVLFALFIALAVDILSNRILEPWQMQRQLGLPLLGTVKLS